MGEKTNWEANNESRVLHSSGPQKNGGKGTDSGDGKLMKAGLAVAAGLIIAALAKGVKNSDYYD